MATKNPSPRADSEGSLGEALYRWLDIFSVHLHGDDITDGTNTVTLVELKALVDWDGDADTVDGQHASEFAASDYVPDGMGDVVGPGSSTQYAVPRYAGLDGTELEDTGVTVDGEDNVKGTQFYNTPGAPTSVSGAVVIDMDDGLIQFIVLSNTVTGFSISNMDAGMKLMLKVKQGASPYTWAWTAGTIVWPSDTAPTITGTANKTDIFAFWSDGTKIYGAVYGQNYDES